jgi:23S rRNA A2030 N6-methylase RlmJ
MFKNFVILIAFLSFSFPAFAEQALVPPNPCAPDNDLACMMELLENDLDSLYSSGAKSSSLIIPISGLALGYAKIKDYKKSEKYRKKLFELNEGNLAHSGLGRVLEQYILDDRNDLVFSAIKGRELNEKECFSLTQMYLYNKDYKNFNKVLKKTNCTVDYIHGVCGKISEEELSTFFQDIKASLPNKSYIKEYEKEVSQCLLLYFIKHYTKGEFFSYDEIIKKFDINFSNKEAEDSLRSYISRKATESEDYDSAVKSLKQTTEPKSKLKQYEKLINSLVSHNDKRALQYNDKLQKYYRSLAEKHSEITDKDYQRLYYALHMTDIGAVLLFDIKEPKLRLTLMRRLLDYIISQEVASEDYPELTKKCNNKALDKCVFLEIKKAYEKIDESERGTTYKSHPLGTYLEAHALMGNYDVLKSHADKSGNIPHIQLIAEKRKDCTTLLHKEIDDLNNKMIENPSVKPYGELRLVAECFYTSDKYIDDILHSGKSVDSPILKEVITIIPSRMIYNPRNILENIKIAYLDIDSKQRERIIDQSISSIGRQNFPAEKKEEALKAVEEFLLSEGNYNYRQLNNLYYYYLNNSYEDRAEKLLSKNSKFSQEQVKEKNKQISNRPIKLSQRAVNTGARILDVIQKERDFNPRYKIKINSTPMNIN